MRIISLLLFLFLGFSIDSFSQNSLQGKVTDRETNESLPGANLYFNELKIGTLTDSSGNYHFYFLPKGNYMMEVHFLGYETRIIAVITGVTKELNIQISPSATEMQEVVITGVSSSTERILNPIPSIPVKKDFLLQSSTNNIIDGIARLPGVDQITTGSAISKPVVRGLSYNRVVVLVDGIKHEGQQWGDEHGIELDENAVDKVEIIKGPGSLMYGSDAMAGVINFLGPTPLPKGQIKSEFNTQYQGNSGLINTSLMNTGSLADYYWLGRITTKKAGDYSNPVDGKVFNSGVNEFDGNVLAGIRKKWGYSQLQISSFNQELGLIEGERDSTGHFVKEVRVNDTLSKLVSLSDTEMKGFKNSITTPDQKITHNQVTCLNSIHTGLSRLEFSVSWQENKRKEFGDVLNPDKVGLFFSQQTYLSDVRWVLPEIKGWKISTGMGSEFKYNQNLGHEFLIPDFNSTGAGAFVFVQKKYKSLFISGGLRYDLVQINSSSLYLDSSGNLVEGDNLDAKIKFESFTNHYQSVTGSMGFSVLLRNDLVGRLNLSKGFRAPNPAELGSNGIHEGTFRYEVGNHDLKPESSLQLDAGLTLNRHHITIDINGFVNNINNYIYPERNDIIPFKTSDIYSTFLFVQDNAILFGGEVAVDIHPHPLDWLHIENSFSYVVGEHKKKSGEVSQYLPFIPAPRLQSEIRVQLPKPFGHFQSSYLEVGGSYYFKQGKIFSAYNTETTTPDYFLLKTGFGSDFINSKKKTICRIFVSADNLLNIAYQSHLSRLKYAPVNPATGKTGVYNPGRNVMLKLVIPF